MGHKSSGNPFSKSPRTSKSLSKSTHKSPRNSFGKLPPSRSPRAKSPRSKSPRPSSKSHKLRASHSGHGRHYLHSHEKSHSEDVSQLLEGNKLRLKDRSSGRSQRRQKTEGMEQVLNFVSIDMNHGRNSPTDSKTLLDHLVDLELDVETPSDEESLIYVPDDVADEIVRDPDIDLSYDWNQSAGPKKKKRKKKLTVEDSDVSDDEISLLSTNVIPAKIDGDDDDTDYSEDDEDGDSLHSSEDVPEGPGHARSDGDFSSSGHDEEDVADSGNLSKEERRRRRREIKKR